MGASIGDNVVTCDWLHVICDFGLLAELQRHKARVLLVQSPPMTIMQRHLTVINGLADIV